jgi:hypothetical protein
VIALACLVAGTFLGWAIAAHRARAERHELLANTIQAWVHFEHPGPIPDLGPYRASPSESKGHG